MKSLKIIFVLTFATLLSSCATTSSRPDLNVQSGGATMELTQSALISVRAALSPDGNYLLIGGLKEGGFRLWDVTKGVQVKEFRTGGGGFGSMGISVAFSPDGKYGLSGGKDIKLWDLSSGKEIRTIGDTSSHVSTVSADGSRVLSVSGRSMSLYDVATGKLIRKLSPGGAVVCAALSQDGKHALTGFFAGRQRSNPSLSPGKLGMILWDLSTGEAVRTFEWNRKSGFIEYGVHSVALSPDDRYAAAGDDNGYIEIWDVRSGTELKRVKAHTGTGGVGYVAFSKDGRYFLSGGADGLVKVWDASSGSEVKTLRYQREGGGAVTGAHIGGAAYAAISPDGKRLITMGTDASVRILDFATGAEIAAMVGFEGGEWLAITPEGYYNASEKGAQYLKVKYEEKDYSVDQFYDVFYRPDIVAAKLGGQDISGLISITMKDASKSPPPSVEFTTKPSDTNQSKVKVCYEARSAGGGIGEVRLFHNGKLVESDGFYKDMAKTGAENMKLLALNSGSIYENMRSIRVQSTKEAAPIATVKAKGELFQDCKEIEVVPGENEIGVTAFNTGNTIQGAMKTAKFSANVPSEDPRVYIVLIGIDQYADSSVSLKYAAKDAMDMKQKLIEESKTIFKPQNIHYELLTDKDATKPNIIGKINGLSKVVKPGDSFILFVAGHGVLLQNQYYMLARDYNGTVNSQSMISSNELIELSKNIKSLSQLLIFDTCHAGGVDAIVSGLYDARMSVLAKKMGLHIYASASSKEAAMDGYQGNGLFTHALLEGLNNKKEADKNNDGKISLVELGDYSKQETITTSKKSGNQQTPLIINFGKDSPVYQLR